MILLIDNYDSFSYNLYQMIGEMNSDIKIVRNDKIDLSNVRELSPEVIIISPGPGRPVDAGISIAIVKEFYKEIPILGVCLGHQAIYQAFGGKITYSKKLVHGKSSIIELDLGNYLFNDLQNEISVGRYHSLSANKESLPKNISIIAKSKVDNEIMAISHEEYPVYGLQFHPESILTPNGKIILKNFLNII
ncbi:MAG: aminodeoxychorismate/anthranilate synthase component II [Methanobrevibacter sp.]|jgi:anthranilate synthase component 2|nr:aminodeoxychorismate/anthranilate synthase component II [Candidatus Methanovirga basalitermitum]